MKSTIGTMQAGMDHEMPIPQQWAPAKLSSAMASGSITTAMIDKALERRYTQMFRMGIFDRPLVQTAIDFTTNGKVAHDIGTKSAVLLQNNGALPIASTVTKVAVVGKASQVYAQQAVAGGSLLGKPMGAGGGSSDVVPSTTVAPVDGIKNTLKALGNTTAAVQLILVDDANATATIDGRAVSFAEALAAAAAADAVVVMAGTVSEEGADRATMADGSSVSSTTVPLAPGAKPSDSSLDWYATASSSAYATVTGANAVRNSQTVAMIKALMGATSTTARTMVQKTALVLKDNAGVSMDPALVGTAGPSILEAWFPGQEDGNIVADLLFGVKNPSGKLPVTFPFVGKGFLDHVTLEQFPGVVAADGVTQTVNYTEGLHIGYRWYDANKSGECTVVNGSNPCVAFPFGHGLSYTTFTTTAPSVALNSSTRAYDVKVKVTNTGTVAGSEVVQVYLTLPAGASSVGLEQPPKRLVGFQKIELAAGASKDIVVSIDPNASNHPLSAWSKSYNLWITPSGAYTVQVGTSSAPSVLAAAGTFTR
jgi:beta-glucosidase